MRKTFTLGLLIANILFSPTISAADFTVTSTADSGPGTLRQAILDADANGSGQDNIYFNITAYPAMIILNTSLTVNTPVVIDGYSQPGAVEAPINSRQLIIGLNFNGFNSGSSATDGLIITTGNITIRGIAIYRANRGIVINGTAGTGGAVRIQGCTIGLSETNQTSIEDPNTGEFFGTRNTGNGVEFLQTSSGFAIPRVFLGVDGDGTNDANEGNLISNNGGDGVFLQVSDYNVIAGNFIGTTATGAQPTYTGTNNTGITLNGNYTGDGAANNRIGTNGDGVSDNVEGNLISGNRFNGIVLQSRGSNNVIAGNTIGLSLSGGANANGRIGGSPTVTPTFLTQGNGILLNNVSGNTIGVTPGTGVAAQRNYISANLYNGITLYSTVAGGNGEVQNNTIMGNSIGVNSANADRGNQNWGIFLSNSAAGFTVNSNFIGSNDDGTGDALEGNIIAYNQRDGIGLLENVANTVYDNRISRNSMFGNQRPGAGTQGFGLGINLMTSITDGTTLNNPSGVGPNFLTNYPVTTLFGVDPTAQKIRVTGTCPSGTYVQYYTASSDANQDNANFNEGQTYLFGRFEGGLDDENPADGVYTFTLTFAQLAAAIGVGESVVALSHTSESGISNTSEFSQRSNTSLALLPVQFVTFKAELQNDKVLVSWSTASEQNSSHYDVERSSNGTDFNRIGSVKAQGNSNSLVNYSFVDANPVAGISYYRLRQVDLDNRYVYTKTAVVRNESRSRAFSVWPNPVIDNVNITLTSDRSQNLSLRVVDLNGRVVRSQVVNVQKGMNQVTLNVNSLNKGLYVVQLIGENLNYKDKLIKQ